MNFKEPGHGDLYGRFWSGTTSAIKTWNSMAIMEYNQPCIEMPEQVNEPWLEAGCFGGTHSGCSVVDVEGSESQDFNGSGEVPPAQTSYFYQDKNPWMIANNPWLWENSNPARARSIAAHKWSSRGSGTRHCVPRGLGELPGWLRAKLPLIGTVKRFHEPQHTHMNSPEGATIYMIVELRSF